jgi:hypothetical protein
MVKRPPRDQATAYCSIGFQPVVGPREDVFETVPDFRGRRAARPETGWKLMLQYAVAWSRRGRGDTVRMLLRDRSTCRKAPGEL